jgi:hypothetical protein
MREVQHVIAKVIGFVLRSDRQACIFQIKKICIAGHAEHMAAGKRQAIRPAWQVQECQF